MKKIIALSLTLALSSAGAVAAVLPHTTNCEECSAIVNEHNIVDRDMLIGNGFAVINQEGEFNVVPQDNVAPNTVNTQNTLYNNDYNNTNNAQYNQNNLSYAQKGTSPYGIGNANSGVLPNNGNGNQTVDNINYNTTANTQTKNLDSMVRTNNLDTYKNNANKNIDNNTYDNNGGNILNRMYANDTINPNTQPTTNNTTPSTRNIAKTQTNTQTSNTRTNTTNVSKKQTNNTLSKTTQDSTTLPTQNNTISSLQSQLTTQRDEFNQKIEKINSILQQYDNKTLELNGEQATMMNGYVDVVQKLTHKLMRSRYIMAFDVENFWNNTAFDLNDTSNPYYLEIKIVLGERIICLDCINEALDNIVDILNNQTSSTQAQRNTSSGTNQNTTTQTKNANTASNATNNTTSSNSNLTR